MGEKYDNTETDKSSKITKESLSLGNKIKKTKTRIPSKLRRILATVVIIMILFVVATGIWWNDYKSAKNTDSEFPNTHYLRGKFFVFRKLKIINIGFNHRFIKENIFTLFVNNSIHLLGI